MLANVDELDKYLQAGFHHFAGDLEHPFNSSKVAMKHKPIPQGMGDHILSMAGAVQGRVKQSGEKPFLGLSQIVALCIVFDIVRRGRKGTKPSLMLKDWLILTSGPTEELFKNHYAALCKAALQEFCWTTWPCEFQDKKGRASANFKSTHLKGHQDSRGNVIGVGPYKSSLNPDKFSDRWVRMLAGEIDQINNKLSRLNLQSARHRVQRW